MHWKKRIKSDKKKGNELADEMDFSEGVGKENNPCGVDSFTAFLTHFFRSSKGFLWESFHFNSNLYLKKIFSDFSVCGCNFQKFSFWTMATTVMRTTTTRTTTTGGYHSIRMVDKENLGSKIILKIYLDPDMEHQAGHCGSFKFSKILFSKIQMEEWIFEISFLILRRARMGQNFCW